MRPLQCRKGSAPRLDSLNVQGHKLESRKPEFAHWLGRLIQVNLRIIWSLFYSLPHKSEEMWGLGESEQYQLIERFFFFCQQLLWEGSLCCIHAVKIRLKAMHQITATEPHKSFFHTLHNKKIIITWLMEIFFLLDIIIKFAVLKRVKYIQLANRSTKKFFFSPLQL